MYSKIYKDLTEQVESILLPHAKFNKIMAKNISDLIELNLDSMRNNSDNGIVQFRELSEIKDLKSLSLFNGKQLTNLSQRCLDDCNRFSEITKKFRADIDDLIAENTGKSKSAS